MGESVAIAATIEEATSRRTQKFQTVLTSRAIADSEGYAISQQKRKLIEQGFCWAKTVGHMRQVLVRGIKKVDQMFVLTMACNNLTRLRSLGQKTVLYG